MAELLKASRAGRTIVIGFQRPDILLYGEPHPHAEAVAQCVEREGVFKPDLLIISGTSLNSTNSSYWHTALAKWAKEIHKSDGALVIYMGDTPPPAVCQRFIDFHLTGNLEGWSQKIVSQWAHSNPGCRPDLPV
ncbi:hypothetical protein FRC06_005280 [Ceratobasidium sp. 370]|nr:hypothetical protein FRC06_005280 [Ceratobasidium sp. 370]